MLQQKIAVLHATIADLQAEIILKDAEHKSAIDDYNALLRRILNQNDAAAPAVPPAVPPAALSSTSSSSCLLYGVMSGTGPFGSKPRKEGVRKLIAAVAITRPTLLNPKSKHKKK